MFAAWVGFAVVYLGEHWLIDVIAGAGSDGGAALLHAHLHGVPPGFHDAFRRVVQDIALAELVEDFHENRAETLVAVPAQQAAARGVCQIVQKSRLPGSGRSC